MSTSLKTVLYQDLKKMKELSKVKDSPQVMSLLLGFLQKVCIPNLSTKLLSIVEAVFIRHAGLYCNFPSHILLFIRDILNVLLHLQFHPEKSKYWMKILNVLILSLKPFDAMCVVKDMMGIIEVLLRIVPQKLLKIQFELWPSFLKASSNDAQKSNLSTTSIEKLETSMENASLLENCTITVDSSDSEYVRLLLTQLGAEVIHKMTPSYAFINNYGTSFTKLLVIQIKFGTNTLKYHSMRFIEAINSLEGGVSPEFEREIKRLLFPILRRGQGNGIWPKFRDKDFDTSLARVLGNIPSNLNDYDHDAGIFPYMILSTFKWNIMNSQSSEFKQKLAEGLYKIASQGGFDISTLTSLFDCLHLNDTKTILVSVYRCVLNRYKVNSADNNDDASTHIGENGPSHPIKRRKTLNGDVQISSLPENTILSSFFGSNMTFKESLQEFQDFKQAIESIKLDTDYIEALLKIFGDQGPSQLNTILVHELLNHVNNRLSENVVEDTDEKRNQNLRIISCIESLTNNWENVSISGRRVIIHFLEAILPLHQEKALQILVHVSATPPGTTLNLETILLNSLNANTNESLLISALSSIPHYAKFNDLSIINRFHTKATEICKQNLEVSETILLSVLDCLLELLKCVSTEASKGNNVYYGYRIAQNFNPLFWLLEHDSAEVRSRMIDVLTHILAECPVEELHSSADYLKNAILHTKITSETERNVCNLFSIIFSSKKVATIFQTDTLIELVDQYIQIAKENLGNTDEQLHIMDLLNAIAQNLDGMLLKKVLFFYLDCFEFPILKTKAFEHLTKIANLRGKQFSWELFVDDFHEPFFEEWLPDKIYNNKQPLSDVLRAVFDTDIKSFVNNRFMSIVAPLIFSRNIYAIRKVCEIVGKSLSDMCEANGYRKSLSIFFAHFAMRSNHQSAFEETCSYLKEVLLPDTKQVEKFPNALKYALFHIIKAAGKRWIPEETIIRGLEILEKSFKDRVSNSAHKNLLREQFFEFTDTLFSEKASLSNTDSRIAAQKSFSFLIQKMGKDAINVAPRILSTLRIGFQTEALVEETLKTYFLLLQQMGQSASPYLREIFVNILPFLERYESIASKILHYLLVDQASWTKHHFGHLPELPDSQLFEKFKYILSTEIGTKTLEKRITIIIEMLQDQSSHVQSYAISQLKDLLRKHHEDVRQMVLSGNEISINSEHKSLISRLASALIQVIRVISSDETREDAAECIGLLGAIDYSYLSDISTQNEKMTRVSNEELIMMLLKKCVVHLTGDSHDFAAYSIQEFLRILNRINKRFKSAYESEIERRLFEQIEPYENTRYLTYDSGSSYNFTFPIFTSIEGASTWLKHLARALINLLNEKCRDRDRLKILEKSYNMMMDGEIAIIVMTYLLELSVEVEAGINEILAEIDLVLNYCLKHQENIDPTKEHVGIIFQLLDNLQQLLNDSSNYQKNDKNREALEDFLSRIPKLKMSEVAYLNKAYARAYMYLEEHLKATHVTSKYTQPRKDHLKIDFSLQAEEWRRMIGLYRHLDEGDGFHGFSSLNSFQLQVSDQLLLYEGQAEWNHALDCYEQVLATIDNKTEFANMMEGMLESMKNLGHLKIMQRIVEGSTQYGKSIQCYGLQSAWRLNDWSSVDMYLQQLRRPPAHHMFEYQLAKCLLAFTQNSDHDKLSSYLKEARWKILPSLKAACTESYSRAYPYLIQLQMLSEIDIICSKQKYSERNAIINFLNQGLAITRDSVQVKEPLLSLRRIIFSSLDFTSEISNSWIKWAKICRKAAYYQTAHSAILQASSFPSLRSAIEKAKLLWEIGEYNKAINEVESKISNEYTTSRDEYRILEMKRNQLAVVWNEKTQHQTHKQTISSYETLIEEYKNYEDAHFHFALFLDQVLQQKLQGELQVVSPTVSPKGEAAIEAQNTIRIVQNAVKTIQTYAQSLRCGNKFMFHAMPRMLAIFFDSIEKCLSTLELLKSEKGKHVRPLQNETNEIILELCSIIQKCADDIPPFKWYPFVDQMNNNWIRKNSEEACTVIRNILVKLMISFPEQSIWQLMYDLNRSLDPDPDTFMEKVLSEAASEEKDGKVYQVKVSAEQFYEKFAPFARDYKDNNLSLVQDKLDKAFKPFRALLKQSKLDLIIPTDEFLYIPHGGRTKDINPFRNPPLISGMSKKFTVMQSQAKPRKIVFFGELHGNLIEYPFLVKPRDDLRKDRRVMNFFSLLNRLIQKDPDSKRRKLKLNTFSCLPLGPNKGLVEWVGGTTVLVNAITEHYPRDEHQRIVRAYYKKRGSEYEIDVKTFENMVLPSYPPKFSRFFTANFTDPAKWFDARLNYCRSCATYSMVGSLIGLGDRHLENILLLSNGELVHIDFDCLFEKGKKLRIAEQVPFRLTSNLIDGMGINQHEGVFRRTANIVLSLMRKNRDAILTIFSAFINDFTRGEKKNVKSHREYHRTEQGLFDAHFKRIEGMLDGYIYAYDNSTREITKACDLPLSVSGQVDRLITQATSTERLCSMYVWWLPFV